MSESSPRADMITALSLISHVYLTPVLVELIRGGVPDHLANGPLSTAELAKRAELNELSLTRALRALAASGAFQEVSPGMFANTSVSDFFRDRPGSLRNVFLFWGSEHVIQSAAALGHSMRTGEASFVHVFGESFWDRMHRWSSRKCFPMQNEYWLSAESGVAASCWAAASSIPFPPGAEPGSSARFFTTGLTPIAAPSSRTAGRPCARRIGC